MHALCALLTPWGAALLLGPSLLALAAAGGGSASPLACVDAGEVEAAAATACGGEYSVLPLLRGAVVCREPFTWSAAMRGKLGDRLTEELRAVSDACAASGVLIKVAGGARLGAAPAATTANPFGGAAAGGASSLKGASATLWSAQALQAADAYKAVYGSAASSSAAGPGTAASTSAKAAPRAAAAASIAAAIVLSSPKAPSSETSAQAAAPRAGAPDDEPAGAASEAVTPGKTAASRPSGAGNPFAF
jgi:hypothetical protein